MQFQNYFLITSMHVDFQIGKDLEFIKIYKNAKE